MTSTRNGDSNRSPRPDLPREFIERERRRRFALAAAALAHDVGRAGVTATLICQRARGAKDTFYDVFSSADDCLRYGVGEAREGLLAPIREADGDGEWLLETEMAITGFYAAVAEEPLLAELLLVHSFSVDSEQADWGFAGSVEDVAALLLHGREAAAHLGVPGPPPLAEEFHSRMVLSWAKLSLAKGECARLPSQARDLAFSIGITYLGLEETGRILGSLDALSSG